MTTTAPEPTANDTTTPAAEGSFGDSLSAIFEDVTPSEVPPEAGDLKELPEPTKAAPVEAAPVEGVKDTPDGDPLADALADLEEASEEKLKDWTPEAAHRFKELKTELKTIKARAAELEATNKQYEQRTKELEAVAGDERVKQLEQQLAEYESKLLLTRLEETSVFKKSVREPIAQLVGDAETLAAKYSINPDDLIDAILQTDEAVQEERFTELLTPASDRDKYKVYDIVEKLKPVIAKRDELYAKNQEALAEAEALERSREQAQLVERLERRKEAAKSVANTLTSKIPFVRSLEGLDFDSVVATAAETDPSALDPVEGTYRAIAGKLFPKVAAQYLKARQEIEALTEQLAEFSEIEPKAGGGSTPRRTSSTSSNLSFVDAVDQAFGG
jgi:hypothetical protein